MSYSDTPVWARGDHCMSPYSGDSKLYQGTIQKIQRSQAGQVLAVIKFDGYTNDDCEEVDVKRLQKVTDSKNKSVTAKRKRKCSPVAGGLFSPLEGFEESQRLKSKFESDEETDEISVKSEKLTSVLFDEKSSKSGGHGNSARKQSRKGKVAVGGETIKKNGRTKLPVDKRETVLIDSPSPTRRKRQLDITGGEAKDPMKELYSSKRISDVSSMLDPDSVKKALQKRGDHTISSSDDEEFHASGFDEEDMEKPKFTFSAEGAKVPFILSSDDVTPVIQVPGVLNQYLRDYQRDGIKFLYNHYSNNTGAILGDDMGLGKTVQVIGFLSALLGKQGNRIDIMRQRPKFIRKMSDTASVSCESPSQGPFLIIGPGCVLYNWLEELETWGYFTVRKYHGSDKAECIKDLKKGKIEIIVTTFETFREHLEVLNAIDWDAVIVDEVHKIKDMRARTTKALRSINTMKRFGLTGTALQNNLLEFWSLLDWARPGCLGAQNDFVSEYVRPIEGGQRHDANKRELATARKQKEKLAHIRKSMMIRRLKSLISDQLPKKDDNVVFCRLSQLQLSMYKTILRQPGMELVMHMDDPCHCDSGELQSKCCRKKTRDGQSIRSLMFTFMHLLLKVSNHVALLIPNAKTTAKQEKTARKICEAALKDHPEFVEQTRDAAFRTLSDPKYCGKMKILQGLLKVFYKEHSKSLVFSYSTRVLDIIEQYLMSTGYEYRRIDGQVSSKKRLDIVREYNHDPNIFICLISTKAGGLGLNLTGANKVVIFDPNWNPTHDLQAQDRAYRIGQRRDVHVYRLVSSGSIEENMYLRQIYKQQLLNVTVEDENSRRYFYAVQGNPQQKGELFGVKNMFVLRTGESCITRDIIKRNERVESAIEGFETARYISPVVRIEEDEDLEDYASEVNTTTSESDDFLAELFSSDDNVDDIKDEENGPKDDQDINKSDAVHRDIHLTIGEADVDIESEDQIREKPLNVVINKRKKVTFGESSSGKVRPEQSRKGKAPVKRLVKTDVVEYDQTLAGTFSDVSEVFDNCGVIHIHKNVKVVGGSRAEDHMSKCAVSDVYELQQNSQDLAVQCEPMSESSEDEDIKQKQEKRKQTIEDYNKVRSEVVGHTKALIGQTPRSFRLKHLKELCEIHSSGSLLEFAELVLNSRLDERINLLNSYYGNKHPELKSIHTVTGPVSGQTEAQRNRKRRTLAGVKNKVTKNRRQVRSRRPAGTISFLEDVEPDSESISQHSLKAEHPLAEESSVESLEVGRKTVCKRKQLPNKLCKKIPLGNTNALEVNKYVEYVTQRYMGTTIDTENPSTNEERKGIEISQNDAENLLDEIGKHSDVIDNIDEKRKVNNKTHKDDNSADVSNVLDDIFSENSKVRKRKPAPIKQLQKISPSKRSKQGTSHSKIDEYNQFKAVDEIFNHNLDQTCLKFRNNGSSKINEHFTDLKDSDSNEEVVDIEINFDVSTLKDENDTDLFDNPKLWKKKRKKPRDTCTAADRMIADSDADYQELFTSGKMKKMPRERSLNCDISSQVGMNGSESLFS